MSKSLAKKILSFEQHLNLDGIYGQVDMWGDFLFLNMSPHFHWHKSFATNLSASFTDKNGARANTK